MFLIDEIAEARIAAAIERGDFEDLPGVGQPLELDDDRDVPQALRIAYRILKNAGCLPPELELRSEITRAEQLLITTTDPVDRSRLTKKISYLMTRLSLYRGTEIDLRTAQRYYNKIEKRFAET